VHQVGNQYSQFMMHSQKNMKLHGHFLHTNN